MAHVHRTPDMKTKELKKTGGQAPRVGRKAIASPTKKPKARLLSTAPAPQAERAAAKRSKRYSLGIARGGITGGKSDVPRTPSVGHKGRPLKSG